MQSIFFGQPSNTTRDYLLTNKRGARNVCKLIDGTYRKFECTGKLTNDIIKQVLDGESIGKIEKLWLGAGITKVETGDLSSIKDKIISGEINWVSGSGTSYNVTYDPETGYLILDVDSSLDSDGILKIGNTGTLTDDVLIVGTYTESETSGDSSYTPSTGVLVVTGTISDDGIVTISNAAMDSNGNLTV